MILPGIREWIFLFSGTTHFEVHSNFKSNLNNLYLKKEDVNYPNEHVTYCNIEIEM